ncbi:MAG: hypothetical protein QM723_27920 [Myxococcaceae bacterium]
MGLTAFVVAVAGVAAHSDTRDPAATIRSASFRSFADAADAGEVQRGWLAASVPRDAVDLVEWHDLGTAECYGAFTLARAAALDPAPAPAGFAHRVAAAQRVHPEDARLARVARSRDVFVACKDSGKFASIVAVIARDAEAGVYWCEPRLCSQR